MKLRFTREFILLFITGLLLLALIILLGVFIASLISHITLLSGDDLKAGAEPVRFNLQKARELGLPRSR